MDRVYWDMSLVYTNTNMTHKTGGLGISAKISATKDFLQTTMHRKTNLPGCAVCWTLKLTRSFFPGCQQSTSTGDQEHNPSCSHSSQLHPANLPFPPHFLPSHLSPNPSAPYLLHAFHNEPHCPKRFQVFEICMVVSTLVFCNSLSTTMLFLFPAFQFLD